jgi:hypothetical protein
MRIIAVCSNCQRDLLPSQLVEGSQITGRCPWCGTLLAPRYPLLLADAVRRAERAGAELDRALEQFSQGWPGSRFGPSVSLIPSGRRYRRRNCRTPQCFAKPRWKAGSPLAPDLRQDRIGQSLRGT